VFAGAVDNRPWMSLITTAVYDAAAVATQVRVLAPAPVAVKALVNTRLPLPSPCSVAPVVVPARLMARLVELPAPV